MCPNLEHVKCVTLFMVLCSFIDWTQIGQLPVFWQIRQITKMNFRKRTMGVKPPHVLTTVNACGLF